MPTADELRFVLDASAACKRFLDEGHSDAFRSWFRDQVRGGGTFEAPHLLGYEVAHALARRSPAHAADPPSFHAMVTAAVEGLRMHDTAAEVGPYLRDLSAYDASYLALAVRLGAVLVTYDDALAKAARRAGVVVACPRSA